MSEEFKIPTEQDIPAVLVTQRAEEIAVSDGRTAAEVTDADYARARAELSQPAPAEQRPAEPVDGFRRADVAMATAGTQATTGYEDDGQIGAHLVEDGIQAAVQDDFVAGGRATLADTSEGEPEPELEAATFTEPAIAPLKEAPAAKPKARAQAKPAARKAAPKKAAKPAAKKAVKKISPPAKKKSPAKAKAKLQAKPKAKTKAKPAKAAGKIKAKGKAKAKSQPKPKKALRKAAKKAGKKAKVKAQAKTKASRPKAKAKKAAKKRKR